MHRHHPYNSGFENASGRRGNGHYHGPGPERPYRGGSAPRGRGRGRGGGGGSGGGSGGGGPYGGYDDHDSSAHYGLQVSMQGGSGFYNSFDAGGGQDYPYQNGSQSGPPAPYSNQQSNSSQGYSEGYGGGYEDGPDNDYDQGGYGGGPRRPRRDDKDHDSIINERLQREKPCRTLFIRNIKYETNSEDVRRKFEEFGDVKTFFDLIANRGMVFVTYFDLRAAERARDRLQGSKIADRPIDVHYSLPREDGASKNDSERALEFQGTLLVTLQNSITGQPIDDNEVRRKFQQFGDVKAVRWIDGRPDQRYVEFYDTRACHDAFNRLRHQSLQDGVMDIVLMWEDNEEEPRRSSGREFDDAPRGGAGRGRGGYRGRGRGGRGRGGDDFGRAGRDFDRERERGRRYDDDYGGGRGGHRGGYGDDRYGGDRNYGPPVSPQRGGYGGPGPNYSTPPGPSGYQTPTDYQAPSYTQPASVSVGPDDRLEQAKKVQALLAALKAPAPPMSNGPPAPGPPRPGPPPSTYYGQPPAVPSRDPRASYGSGPQSPVTPAYGSSAPPLPPSAASGPAPPAPGSNLPPHVLAMLQQSAAAHQASLAGGGPPQPSSYGSVSSSSMPNGQYSQYPYYANQK